MTGVGAIALNEPGPTPAIDASGEPTPAGAQTFPIGGPGSVTAAPLDRETRIDGRLTESVQYDAAGQLMASYRSADASGYTLTLGDSYALVRTAGGELRLASLAEVQSSALEVVAGPGQSIVGGGPRLFILPQGASPDVIAAAGSMAVAVGQRATLGAFAEATANAAARIGTSTVLEDLAATLPRVLGVAGLLLAPGNLGQDTVTQPISPDMRLVTRPGELRGAVEFQVTDDRGNAQWVRVQDRQFDPEQARQLAASLRTSMLTPAEIERALAPISTPMPPPAGPSVTTTPPLTDAQREPLERPTTTPADPQAAIPLPGYAIAPSPTMDDLLIERRNAEILGNNLEQAGQSRPGGYEAHHIVPSEAGDARMEALRAKLAGLGIDLNNAANGVWLPGPNAPEDVIEAYHRRLNNKVYNKAVADAFVQVTNKEDALDTLARIRSQLENAKLPGVRPRP